jgi:hypothetical protein
MSTRDIVVLSVLLVAFAALVTAHVTIAAGLVRRRPRARALLAFIVVPLAPYYAARAHMGVRAFAWVGALVVYVTAVVLART